MKHLLPKIIMVIDDCEDSLDLIKLLLVHRGFEVLCAKNGYEALHILEGLESLPHLILLDANMPVMNGFSFRIYQKKSLRFAQIPVVVMSGDIDLDLRIKMLDPEGIVKKPLQMNKLIEDFSQYII